VCWPAELDDAEADAEPEQPLTLQRGRDFDDVVLALPAGAMVSHRGAPSPCASLLERNARLRALFERMNLVPTIAAQLWVDRDLRGLGWERPPPALVGFGRPLDVWVDMSQVLDVESWPAGARPRGLHYFCGSLPAEVAITATGSERAARTAVALAAAQLERRGPELWPLARTAAGSFDWNVLHDPQGREGPRRLEAQYVRANVEPSDLCDASAPGTTRLRPEAHESGLDNLALCGTWTRTSLNTTCVEAAVMSGMAAAHAVTGEGRAIVGDGFLCRPFSMGTLPRSRIDDVGAPPRSTRVPLAEAIDP
jgi:hypothetical protein